MNAVRRVYLSEARRVLRRRQFRHAIRVAACAFQHRSPSGVRTYSQYALLDDCNPPRPRVWRDRTQ